MLLRFGVSNHRSFRDYTEVSLLGTRLKDEPSLTFPSRYAPFGVLPVLGAFGANASGKSNLLDAFEALVSHVRDSSAARRPGDPVPRSPWRGPGLAADTPTQLDVDLLVNGVRHHYGFRFTESGYTEEWLFRWPGRARQVVFHRNHAEVDPWYFGPTLKGARQLIAEATRADGLFLSTAAQLNHGELGEVAEALVSRTTSASDLPPGRLLLPVEGSALLDAANRTTVLGLLGAADLGVHDLVAHPVNNVMVLGQEGRHAEIVMRLFVASVRSDHPGPVRLPEEARLEVRMLHGDPTVGGWELPQDQESRGTIALLARLADVLDVLAHGRLLVIDEIDTSLHPDLCAALVGLFTDPRSNPHGAQLLFSTHDRGLLRHLRRDEVLFVDKDAEGVSRVHAASDFRGIRARDDLRKAHEDGRLGGVPVLGDLAEAASGLTRRGP